MCLFLNFIGQVAFYIPCIILQMRKFEDSKMNNLSDLIIEVTRVDKTSGTKAFEDVILLSKDNHIAKFPQLIKPVSSFLSFKLKF